MARNRLFIGCSFSDEMVDLRDYIEQQVIEHGSFTPVFGDSPDVINGPAVKVRELIASCDAAMIIEAAERSNAATPWIFSEMGMAYQQRLPILALVDIGVADTGITRYAVSYVPFDPKKFSESRGELWNGLVQLEQAVEDLGHGSRSPENALKRALTRVLPPLLLDMQAKQNLDPSLMSSVQRELEQLFEQARNSQQIHAESDSFGKKLFTTRAAKQGIADYVFANFLAALHDSDEQIVMDSGTVTFTICEKLATETCRVRIITNNVAVGRQLSELPQYPCFILPGLLESRYLASLGEETDKYLREMLKQERVKLGFIAATSFGYKYGIAGNDPRHASFKKVILEECPCAVIVFEGEKIIQHSGNPIYASSEQWNAVLESRKGSLYVVTHQPEEWERLSNVKRNLYERTIVELRKKLGENHVIALSPGASTDAATSHLQGSNSEPDRRESARAVGR